MFSSVKNDLLEQLFTQILETSDPEILKKAHNIADILLDSTSYSKPFSAFDWEKRWKNNIPQNNIKALHEICLQLGKKQYNIFHVFNSLMGKYFKLEP